MSLIIRPASIRYIKGAWGAQKKNEMEKKRTNRHDEQRQEKKRRQAGSASDNLPSIVEVAVGEAELSEKEPDLLVGPVQYGTDSHHVRPALVRHLYTQYKREELE